MTTTKPKTPNTPELPTWMISRPFFPLPTADHSGAIPQSPYEFFGRCSPWCANDPRGVGLAVSEHGPVCVSHFVGPLVPGLLETGEATTLAVDLWRPYLHGLYRSSDAVVRDQFQNEIRLRSDSEKGSTSFEFSISSSHARTLAATLLRAADWLDFGDAPRKADR